MMGANDRPLQRIIAILRELQATTERDHSVYICAMSAVAGEILRQRAERRRWELRLRWRAQQPRDPTSCTIRPEDVDLLLKRWSYSSWYYHRTISLEDRRAWLGDKPRHPVTTDNALCRHADPRWALAIHGPRGVLP